MVTPVVPVLRSLAVVGVLLMPVVCVVHVASTVWVYRHTSMPVRLLLLLPFLITLALLAGAAFLLWMVINTDDRYDAAMVVALAGLAFCYLFSFTGVGDWMLRWQGTETTCTILGVGERQEWMPTVGEGSGGQGSEATHHDYTMTCTDADAPDEMTADGRTWAVGARVAVVYDPSGAWGTWDARPAEELELGNTVPGVSAWCAGTGATAWTLPAPGCALTRLRGA